MMDLVRRMLVDLADTEYLELNDAIERHRYIYSCGSADEVADSFWSLNYSKGNRKGGCGSCFGEARD